MISEHSDSTATPDKHSKLEFLKERSAFFFEKTETLRKSLIQSNNEKMSMAKKETEQFNTQNKDKLQTRIKSFLDKAKQAPVEHKVGVKTIGDPREGITRRFANYISIKRYQFTEDTLNIFFPNVSDKYYKKLSDEWKLAHESSFLRNVIDEDLTLYAYITQYGESEEVIETYKKFRDTTCENSGIIKRFKNFRESIARKRANFAASGCSAKVEEGISDYTIIKTHKELYCRRCEVYDCGVHGILGFSNFVHPNAPSPKDLKASYNQMMEMYMLKDKGEKKQVCGDTCYCSFCQNESQADEELSSFAVAKIKLALQIFKFDPCNIRLYFDKGEITCNQIFQYLRKEYESSNFGEMIEESQPATVGAVVLPKESNKSKHNSKSKKNRKHYFPNWKKLEENISVCPSVCCIKSNKRKENVLVLSLSITSHAITSLQIKRLAKKFRAACTRNAVALKEASVINIVVVISRSANSGCDCKSNCLGKKCPCYSLNAECDPDLCKCCFTTKDGTKTKTNNCSNQMIFFRKSKNCKVGPSEVCTGLGLFNIEPISKGEFVCMYIGEVGNIRLISWEEAEMREKWNNYDQETYLCTVSDEYVIDAKYRGNKARFINHGKSHANIFARHVFSKGFYHFGFYAKDDIAPGSELLFDYEGGGSALREQFSWIKHPNAPKKNSKSNVLWHEKLSKQVLLKTGVKPVIEPRVKFSIRSKVRKLRKVELSRSQNPDEDEEEFKSFIPYLFNA